MKRLARQMDVSEVTFILARPPAVERIQGIKVRIFNRAGEELPFAGHPALGTAMAVWKQLPPRAGDEGTKVVLEFPAGRTPVTIAEQSGGIYGEMIQSDPVFAEPHDPQKIAALLGIARSNIVSGFPVQNVSTGRPNLIVLLDSLEVIKSVKMNWPEIAAYFSAGDKQRGFYLLTRQTESKKASLHARKLTPLGEDPATGSAAGCAIAWLVKYGIVPSGERILIEQGIEMAHPAQIAAKATLKAGKVTDVRVGGNCVQVSAGSLNTGEN